jgi:hypothetical protein
VSLKQTYRRLVGDGGRLDEPHAQAIVADAMPHAVATLGLPLGTVLPVAAKVVAPAVARGGSLIPAWPIRQTDGTVVIESVDDWSVLLSGFLAATGADQFDSVTLAQRVWIGVANDVLQLFVADPPPGTYSMVRHHALMLAAATAWLGAGAISAWRAAHAAAGAAFARSCDRPVHEAIEAAERGLETLLADERAHQPAARALAWLDVDPAAGKLYHDYLGAASLGVAAVLDALPTSDPDQAAWLTHAVKDLHANPDFNRVWIAECVFARGGASG